MSYKQSVDRVMWILSYINECRKVSSFRKGGKFVRINHAVSKTIESRFTTLFMVLSSIAALKGSDNNMLLDEHTIETHLLQLQQYICSKIQVLNGFVYRHTCT